jgi:hypothetical protein
LSHRSPISNAAYAILRAVLWAGLALSLSAGARPAGAAETQWWITDSPGDYAKSEGHGVVIRPDGALELGPAVRFDAAESLGVVWSVVPMKDGSVIVGGDRGVLLRFDENGGSRVFARLPVGQVLALAADGDGVVAGTGPDGLIYRVGARGDTALVVRTGERYVWGLVAAPGGGWYAATGTRGRLMRVRPGEARIVLDTEESNLVSLVVDARGAVYAGGDSKGRVYRVTEDRQLRTIFDAAEDEVRALALGPDGALYAAALSASAVSEDEGDPGDRPTPVRSAVSAGRAVVYRILPDSVASPVWTSPQPFVFGLVGTPGGVVAATGNRAALYLLERGSGATQWLQGPQGQITAVATDAAGHVYAGTSNPGGLWRVGPEKAKGGELISPVFDARRFARFGAVRWNGDAGESKLELWTRSGNTDPLDSTWSPWSRGGSDEQPRSNAPVARYFQWRLAASGGAPHVESVEAAWHEQNLAPRVEDLVVAPQGQAFREGELMPRAEAVTQTLPSGQKVEYSLPPGTTQKALRDLPGFARGLRTLQWHASDANGDALHFKVEVRSEPVGAWKNVDDDLEASAFTWDTNGLPDGRYRVRVTASDASANAVGEGLTGMAISAPFTVDNTAPLVTQLATAPQPGALVVTGRAEDASSTLTRIEVSLDNGDWQTVTPDGGFADERILGFRTRLPDVEPGEHTLSVRAVDTAGNTATRASRVTVPRAR